jgi:hypothetical protein
MVIENQIKAMRKVSGSTRIRILAVVVVVVLLWLAYKNYSDFSEAQIEAVISTFTVAILIINDV